MGWEDSEDWLHLSWAASAALFVVAVAVLLSAIPTPTQNDWPAWVQAVGSIGAIWFAGRTVLLQHRSAGLQDMESLSGLVRSAKVAVEDIANLLEDSGPGRVPALRDYPEDRINEITKRLSDFPFYQLGSSKAPHLIIELTEEMLHFETIRRAAAAYGQSEPSAHDLLSSRLARDTAKRARRKVRKWASDRRRRRDRWWYD